MLAHLGLGDTFCEPEALSVPTMDMDVAGEGWDCSSSHDLRLLYVDGRVSLWSGPGQPQTRMDLAALESTQRQAAAAGPVLKDGKELHLASFCVADATLRLAGAEDPAFATLTVKYADVLGWALTSMPQDRSMALELEMGDAPMPRRGARGT